MRIKDALIQSANAFLDARQGDRSAAISAANNLSSTLLASLSSEEKAGLTTKTGLGMGSFADVPWVAVISDRFGGSASKGYFVVYLFSKDGKRVYLSVGVGAGSANSGTWKAADRERVAKMAAILRHRCGNLANVGFDLSGNIDLGSDGWRAGSYAAATAAFKKYEINNMPESIALDMDFTHAVNVFSGLVKEGFNLEPEIEDQKSPQIPLGSIPSSLITKPFLILTGPSGTGKTRGAVDLAEAVCGESGRELVAVGADWTDNRHVLGYLNPLEADNEKRPIYETTPILDLILHANENPHQPHVLILDEMNLSHVERYFADFLSAMELEDKSGALKLHAAGTAITRTGKEVPGSIDFPSNLFVIGTVNIDETTYMFSPKVLDRANVIEIHAEETALAGFLTRSVISVREASKDYGISFLNAALVIQTDEEHEQVPLLPAIIRLAAADRLMALFRIMKRGRGEYGFRTGKEGMAYLRTAHFLAGPEEAGRTAWETGNNWHEALDAQILQKILPKLHGSRSRLAPLLGALAQYCATGDEAYALEHFPGEDGSAPKRGLKDACATPNPVFKNSHEKLKRMIDVLVEEQFVSFIC